MTDPTPPTEVPLAPAARRPLVPHERTTCVRTVKGEGFGETSPRLLEVSTLTGCLVIDRVAHDSFVDRLARLEAAKNYVDGMLSPAVSEPELEDELLAASGPPPLDSVPWIVMPASGGPLILAGQLLRYPGLAVYPAPGPEGATRDVSDQSGEFLTAPATLADDRRKPSLGGRVQGTGYWTVDALDRPENPLGAEGVKSRPALRDPDGGCWASWMNLPQLDGLRDQLEAGARALAAAPAVGSDGQDWVLVDDDPVADAEEAAGVRASRLAEALRLTVEYVGLDILPPVPGWSWYDALIGEPWFDSWLASMPRNEAPPSTDPVAEMPDPDAVPGRHGRPHAVAHLFVAFGPGRLGRRFGEWLHFHTTEFIEEG